MALVETRPRAAALECDFDIFDVPDELTLTPKQLVRIGNRLREIDQLMIRARTQTRDVKKTLVRNYTCEKDRLIHGKLLPARRGVLPPESTFEVVRQEHPSGQPDKDQIIISYSVVHADSTHVFTLTTLPPERFPEEVRKMYAWNLSPYTLRHPETRTVA